MSEEASGEAGQCRWPDIFDDAGPGVRACHVGAAYVSCGYPSGLGCGCISDDPTGCPGCNTASGATCQDQCGPNQYGLSCGGPPAPLYLYADGSGGFVDQEPPDACVGKGVTPAGSAYYCCPCE